MSCLFVVGYQKTDGADPIYCGQPASEIDLEPRTSFIKLLVNDKQLDDVSAVHVTRRLQTFLCQKHFKIVEKMLS